ncbi:MAG: sigma-54 dependent transcriptional regulator [Acidobacteriia bacterium]|nr:sigma-54 dependent transcriptional regulator [Terriglobia bacterium]
MRNVLVVDDEAGMRAALESSFRSEGWDVETAPGVEAAITKFRSRRFPLVVTDMRMPDGDGLDVLQRVRSIAPRTAVIFLTAYGNIPEAVAAMREGACDYLVKPVAFEQLADAVERVLPPASASADQCEFIGGSPEILRVIERGRQVARSEADILIEAESGTGKELLARLIHRHSARRDRPFVAVNCVAVPESLLESEMFGHVRGAFTGAITNRQGKFGLANGGTLLLDEIGEMPLNLQPKLLRVLQERQIDRLGDNCPVKVDVRVIATTNRCLRSLVDEGRFRADLYYRLNVVPLSIPPLRERPQDILALAQHFMLKHLPADRRPVSLSTELQAHLVAHEWPGNVRELENFIRRALALSSTPMIGLDTLEEEDTGAKNRGPHGIEPGISLRDLERHLLEVTLQATGGNRSRAAQMLGISIRTVRNKIREYGLPRRTS